MHVLQILYCVTVIIFTVKNRIVLRIAYQGSKIMGRKQMTMAQLYHRPLLGKVQSICLDDSHPMYREFSLLAFVIEPLLVKQIGLDIHLSTLL